MVSLSVIIPTWNEAASIAAAIASAVEGGADEVIVADGGSEDRTIGMATAAGAVVVESPPGRGPQQNAGARVAHSDWLLFLHADCRLQDGCRMAIEDAAAASEGIVAGGFAQRIDSDAAIYRLIEEGNAFRGWRGRLFGDQAIWVRRDRFRDVGGFPDWPLFEDVELCRRLGLGWNTRVLLEPPVIVSPRRWQERGVVRQTLLNWRLQWAYRFGVPPEELARRYRARRS